MLNTFLSDMRTQSKTAFSFGIRLIVLSGLKSRKSFCYGLFKFKINKSITTTMKIMLIMDIT